MRTSGSTSELAIQVRRNPDSSTPPRNDQPSAVESVVIVGVSATSAGGLRAAASHCTIPTYDMPVMTTRPSHQG